MFDIYSIAIILATVLSIILFFKVWGMCNDVRYMKKQAEERADKIRKDELIYLSRTNDPAFEKMLLRAIYNDLYAQHLREEDVASWYKYTFSYWVKECKSNNWQFPEILAELDTIEKFNAVFVSKEQ